MKNKITIEKLHLVVITLGLLFLAINLFNQNIWFDETYSVNIVKHNFVDLYNIAVADVHPVGYYILLKLFSFLFFGSLNLITIGRIFSYIPYVILFVLSYTKISKMFSKKVGILFSILIIIMPVSQFFSSEIRMYSWAMLFTFLTALYAYEILSKETKIKTWILFSVFSVLSAYMHYYAFVNICIINLILFINILSKNKKMLNRFFIFGFVQFFAYLPGLITFIVQSLRVSMGFWINVEFPQVIIESLTFYFGGQIAEKNFPMWFFLVLVFAIEIITLFVVNIIKSKKENKEVFCKLVTFISFSISILVLFWILSLKLEVFVTRYMIPMFAIFALAFAFLLDYNKNKIINISIICFLCITSFLNVSILYDKNYDITNENIYKIIDENIQNGDVIVFTNVGVGSVIVTKYPENTAYFYNKDNWFVEKAYSAYSPTMKVIYNLNEIEVVEGRIWLVDNFDDSVYDCYKNENTDFEVVLDTQEHYKYADYLFKIRIIEP